MHVRKYIRRCCRICAPPGYLGVCVPCRWVASGTLILGMLCCGCGMVAWEGLIGQASGIASGSVHVLEIGGRQRDVAVSAAS